MAPLVAPEPQLLFDLRCVEPRGRRCPLPRSRVRGHCRAPPFVSVPCSSRQPSAPLTWPLGVDETWHSRVSTGVQDLVRLMIGRLYSEYGYVVVPVSIPFHHQGQVAHAMTVLTDATNLLPSTRSISPANKILLVLGRRIPAADFLFAQKLRQLLMQRLPHLWRSRSGCSLPRPRAHRCEAMRASCATASSTPT